MEKKFNTNDLFGLVCVRYVCFCRVLGYFNAISLIFFQNIDESVPPPSSKDIDIKINNSSEPL